MKIRSLDTRDGVRRPWVLALPLVLSLLAPLAISAQPPADTSQRDFEPIGDYVLVVNGQDVPQAEIFYSRPVGAFLVMSSSLPAPVLLRPRTGSVETVNLMKISKQADGSVDLLPEPVLASQGQFQVAGDNVEFRVADRAAVLKPKPYLLGPQTADKITGYSAEYARGAAAYQPSAPILGQLKLVQDEVQVEVFFGSWCPACKAALPRILRVAEELSGSKVRVKFYGLPKPFGDEPHAKALGIEGVPTGVVFRGGKEIGRISGNSWKIPELALKNVLG